MKKFFTLAVSVILLSVCAMAQTPAFMGIPIDGNINEFYAKLETKGFVLSEVSEEERIYTGKFTGEEVSVSVKPGYEN